MRRLPSSWNKTLTKLGFTRKKRRRTSARNCGTAARSLRVEPLEDRRMLAVITVTDLNDDTLVNLAGDGQISLREAIEAANTDASVDGSVAGSGADTIVFDSSLFAATMETIQLSGDANTAELDITEDLTIVGPSADRLTILAFNPTFDPITGIDTVQGDGSRIFNINGAALEDLSFVELRGLQLTGGDVTGNGGAILSQDNLTLVDSIITGNRATDAGGGLWARNIDGYSITTAITDSTISNNVAGDGFTGGINEAGDDGGGIWIEDVLTVTGSTISGNAAGDDGGGISNIGQTTIAYSTISDNIANDQGGGIVIFDGYLTSNPFTSTIKSSTVSGNVSDYDQNAAGNGDGAGRGGGVFNFKSSLAVEHSTITNNFSPTGRGSGVANTADNPAEAETLVRSSIIASNRDKTNNLDSDVFFINVGSGSSFNTFQSNGYNLIGLGNASGAFVATGDQSGVTNPKLDILRNNGGRTMTHALLPASPAIDAGDPLGTPPMTDQRGYNRVVDGDGNASVIIDIGAFELQNSGPKVIGVTISGPNSNDGVNGTYAIPTGSGEQLRTVPIGGANIISVEFSKDINTATLTGALTLENLFPGGDAIPAIPAPVYDGSGLTRTATWTFAQPFEQLAAKLTLSDTVTDTNGNSLDGEWVGPTSLLDPEDPMFDSFPEGSGNGIAGGDFVFNFGVLASDFNSDNDVDGFNFLEWQQKFGMTNASFVDGDADGSTVIDGADLDIWEAAFGINFSWQDWVAAGFAAPLLGLSAQGTNQILVSTSADESDMDYSLGDLSLREALSLAAGMNGADEIIFQDTLAGQTIQLDTTLGELVVDSDVTIAGLGVDQLTISGGNLNRVFNVASGVTAEINNLTIADGNAGANNGGAISSLGNLSLVDVSVKDSQAYSGGAIYQSVGTLNITRSSILNNTATYAGGAIWASSAASLLIDASTLAFNTATYVGGIYNLNTDLDIRNSTISTNTANLGYGGGIYVYNSIPGLSAALTNVTVTNNSAGTGAGGGMYVGSLGTSVILNNTIVAGNTNSSGADDVFGTFDSASAYNLIGAIDGSTGLDSDPNTQSGTAASPLDANLAPLSDYGGPTQTHALLNGSLAIDAGDDVMVGIYNVYLPYDQRGSGFARIQENAVDLGAFESGNNSLLTVDTATDENDVDYSTGDFSLREALALTGNLSGTETIVFDAGLAGQTLSLSLGELVVGSDVALLGLGADQLAVSGNNASRVFRITSGVTAVITGITIADGFTTGSGGGISNSGNLTLSAVEIRDNTANEGGGIYQVAGQSATLDVSNSTIAENTATSLGQAGGGIHVGFGVQGDQSFFNVTISGNIGDGYHLDSGGNFTFVNATVTNNTGRGISSEFTSGPLLQNTIVVGNGGSDLYRVFNSNSSFNLIGTVEQGGLTNGVNNNQVGVTAAQVGLTALGYYGGPTRTHALLSGSLAIDAGDDAIAGLYGLSTDQRGELRIDDGDDDGILRTDIGAFELAADEFFGTLGA